MNAKTYDTLAIEAVKKVAPAVVSIVVSKYLPRMHDINPSQLFNPFMMGDVEDGAGQKVKVGGGSGFLVHPSGLILTNKHVVFDAEAEYAVVMNDGSEHAAKVLSRDPINDIAVLKVDTDDLPAVTLANSADIELGLVGNLGDVQDSKFDLALRPMVVISPPLIPLYVRGIFAVNGLVEGPTRIAYGGALGLSFGLFGVGVFLEAGYLPQDLDLPDVNGKAVKTRVKLVEGRLGAYWD